MSLAVYKGNDNLDNSRALTLPTGLLDRLAARGIDLAARGIDLSNPTLEISDVRDSGNTSVGLTWSRQWGARVESNVSLGYSRYQDVRDRSAQFGGNANPSAEANHLDDLTFKASVPVTLAPGHTVEAAVEATANDFAHTLRTAARPAPQEPGGVAPAASYTHSIVEESFPALEAEPFPAGQDQRHELKVVNVYQLGRWTASGTWVFGSGKPYTEPAGLESFTTPVGFTIDRVVVGPKNGARLPAYHRLDVALHREIGLGDGPGKGLFSVTAFNLYNRKNAWYKEFNVVDGEIAENNIRLMGLTVNAAFTVKF